MSPLCSKPVGWEGSGDDRIPVAFCGLERFHESPCGGGTARLAEGSTGDGTIGCDPLAPPAPWVGPTIKPDPRTAPPECECGHLAATHREDGSCAGFVGDSPCECDGLEVRADLYPQFG